MLINDDGATYLHLTNSYASSSSSARLFPVPMGNVSDIAVAATANFAGTLAFSLVATSTEATNGDAANVTLPVRATWLGIAQKPGVALGAAEVTTREDAWAHLNISRFERGGSYLETLSLYVLSNDTRLDGVRAGGVVLAPFNASGGYDRTIDRSLFR